jgi:hypothetical protein
MTPAALREALRARLAAALPVVNRLRVTAHQQEMDATAVQTAIVEAIDALDGATDPARPTTGRTVPDLDVALVRAGRTWAELGFLTSLRESRLKAIAAGDPATAAERRLIERFVPDWRPTGGES